MTQRLVSTVSVAVDCRRVDFKVSTRNPLYCDGSIKVMHRLAKSNKGAQYPLVARKS